MARARSSAINNYRQTDSSEALYATPHRLVQMLMSGVLDGAANGKGAILREQPEERHKEITWTINLIEALRGALDFEEGGEISTNLDSLYDYMIRRLYDGDVGNDYEPLDEVSSLMKEIKEAWDAMPEVLRHADNIRDVAKSMR